VTIGRGQALPVPSNDMWEQAVREQAVPVPYQSILC
jgi:hypothetical protein